MLRSRGRGRGVNAASNGTTVVRLKLDHLDLVDL